MPIAFSARPACAGGRGHGDVAGHKDGVDVDKVWQGYTTPTQVFALTDDHLIDDKWFCKGSECAEAAEMRSS